MKKISLTLLALISIMLLTGCSKSDDNSSGSAEGDWTGWGTGIEPTTLKQDFNKSDMDNFFELNLKMENMRLQFVKFMSNGWEGELLDGPGPKSDPIKMFELLEEILDKKDDYTQAINNLTNQGILDNVTTRGLISSGWEMIVNGWGSTAKNRRIKILTMLEENKVMGNANAQQELFNALPEKLKKGETDAKKWFNNLNQGKYDNACPQIHAYWVNTGAGESGNAGSALGKYYEAAEKAANGKNPLHIDTYKVGVEQAQKAADFNAALWDKATGGYAGDWADADVILSETSKLRQKISDGSATIDDINKWIVGVGGVYAKEKIGDLLKEVSKEDLDDPDWLRICKEGAENVGSEMTDWLIEHAYAEADERAANSNGVTLGEIRNGIENSGGSPTGFILKDENGKITVTGADKDGNGRFVTKAGDKTLTTVTRDGKRATQKFKANAGKQTVEAVPGMEGEYEWYVEIDPQEVIFDYQPDSKAIVVMTYAKFFSAKSNNEDWLHVAVRGTNIIVEVDQNDTGENRTGTITIGLSQDQKTFPKSFRLGVYQRPEPEAADLASFIDFENLSIENLHYYVDTSVGTGDNMTANLRLYNTPFNGSDLTSFAARELTTRRISDNVYEVTGRKVEPHDYDGWTSEEARLAPDDPYGAFYEISFNIEAQESNVLITQNNFVITNFKAQGYYKWRTSHHDNLYKFSFESTLAVIDDEQYSNGSCELTALFADHSTLGGDKKPSWRWEVSQKGFDETQYEDDNHNIHYVFTSKSESNKGSTTSVYRGDFGMTLHW
jgi:hypothetical protein